MYLGNVPWSEANITVIFLSIELSMSVLYALVFSTCDHPSFGFPTNFLNSILKTLTVFISTFQVVKLSDILPSVETIHVCFNSITDLSLSADKFKNLKFLNLEGNKIEKWEYILQLSHLQR